MTIPRSRQIFFNETHYYHCFSRCVRRAFLCGKDRESGKDYNHRKAWVQKRLAELSNIFTIDICAYAIMSNHYHVVLKVNPSLAKALSVDEVIERWHLLYDGNSLTKDYLEGKALSKEDKARVRRYAKKWRKRLNDIGWFMKSVNEWLARKANKEEKCKGRFWEGRYKCQALLDETALLACMVYVDLNPIRAQIASSLPDSDFTSVKQRIEVLEPGSAPSPVSHVKLVPLDGKAPTEAQMFRLPSLTSYIQLVEWTGKASIEGKRGRLDPSGVSCLEQLSCGVGSYVKQALNFEKIFTRAAGSVDRLRSFCTSQNFSWVHGVGKKAPS